MEDLKLKEQVLKKLESADDYLLREVLTLIDFEANEGIFMLSEAQKSTITKARREINEGLSFTNEEVDKEIGSWLNE